MPGYVCLQHTGNMIVRARLDTLPLTLSATLKTVLLEETHLIYAVGMGFAEQDFVSVTQATTVLAVSM